ncbi:hypothetical protein ECEC1846_3775, partial [Escherichia coli EC1846]
MPEILKMKITRMKKKV